LIPNPTGNPVFEADTLRCTGAAGGRGSGVGARVVAALVAHALVTLMYPSSRMWSRMWGSPKHVLWSSTLRP